MICEYHGEKMNIAELSRRCGISANTLYHRMRRQNMTAEQAASIPLKGHVKRKYEFDGETLTLMEIAKRTGIPYEILNTRLQVKGRTVDEAVAMGGVRKERTPNPNGMPEAVNAFLREVFQSSAIARYFMPTDDSTWEWKSSATAEWARVTLSGNTALLEYGLSGKVYVERRKTLEG